MWGATCRNTLVLSHLSTVERGSGLVPAEAESEKKKYSSLGAKYFCVPVASESLGVFGAESFLLKDLGHQLHQITLETHNLTNSCSSAFLWQS